MKTRKPHETALDRIEEGRREAVKKLIVGTAFAAPLMASFSMDGGLIAKAEAAVPYFCGYTPITDAVFRAAFKSGDATVSAIARIDQSDCQALEVNLRFQSKTQSFGSAHLEIASDFDIFYHIPLNEGQNTITVVDTGDISPEGFITGFLDALNSPNVSSTITVVTTGGVDITGDLVGVIA